MSAIVRKSVTDLTRRKARTFFTVLTLALAVASVGIFAVPGLMLSIDPGAAPGAQALLSDRNNDSGKGFDAGAGATARVIAADGMDRSLQISGVGRKLTGGQDDPSNDWITFYATPQTVATLSGAPGYTSLAFRLRDNSRPAAERTIAAVRDRLRATTAFTAFDDMPVVNEPGSYPGKEDF